jgi:hypothetical protein
MTRKQRTILLSTLPALLAPVAGASAPGVRTQQAIAAQLAHRTARQHDETLGRQLDLRQQRARAEAPGRSSAPSPRQP